MSLPKKSLRSEQIARELRKRIEPHASAKRFDEPKIDTIITEALEAYALQEVSKERRACARTALELYAHHERTVWREASKAIAHAIRKRGGE